jgi:hypothetical protein
VVAVDEHARGEQVGPIPKSFLQRLKQSDSTLAPADKENVAVLELEWSTVLDLGTDAHLDRPRLFQKDPPPICDHSDGGDRGRPSTVIELTGNRGRGSFVTDFEGTEIEQGVEGLKGVGFGYELSTIDDHNRWSGDNRWGRRRWFRAE